MRGVPSDQKGSFMRKSTMGCIDRSVRTALCGVLLSAVLAACGKEDAPPPAPAPDAAAPAAAGAPAPAPAPAATAAPPAMPNLAAGPAPDPATPPAPPATVVPIPKGPEVKVTPELVAEGKKLYFSAGCNACHGGTGGGGMCPPLTNDVWVYGSDDDTLRALISEGTAAMITHGKTRIGHEKVVGQMPSFAPVLKPGDTEKLLAFIHSINKTAGKAQ
ncbi:c-type cytochrome [Xanthomonas campestris pv. badrii]|uniref:C-type cytochrome n=1 Tax=Xanthomonas campestris pv. badrii TaxID=149696 RepID=A0A7Z2ZFM8_XANCA|nr:c-type cytochrome [Xanthomonas campestris]MCC4605577.1 cytochrome c [Xanthomonas campestris pv. parthenii]QJD66539.1 c-type cytochrome [Xanthomonas campestris pv. badrii]